MEAEREQRVEALVALARRWADDPAIAAARDGSNLVLGAGNPLARLVLIGEAPGGQEEKAGRPFVGPAGKLLDEALAAAGLARDEVWITNVVKFRPTVPGVGNRRRNRAPTRDESQLFLPWLREELAIIEPKALVCLGATAARAMIGQPVKIMSERGRWFTSLGGRPTMLTYHPAFLLRRTTDYPERFAELASDLRTAGSFVEADDAPRAAR